jgi:hypothetical protein
VRRAEPIPAPDPQPDLETALRGSGLVMIETDPSKAKDVVTENDEVAPPRARRERRPPPPDLSAPLVQIETRKTEGDAPSPS